jgi:hypothetical protein
LPEGFLPHQRVSRLSPNYENAVNAAGSGHHTGQLHLEFHGFRASWAAAKTKSNRALCQGMTSQASEKRPIALHFACFVTGHDFSRAATALESKTGFSPC